MKVGACEFKDGDPAVEAAHLTNLRLAGTPTFTNIPSGSRYKVETGSLADTPEGRVFSMPFNGSRPSTIPVGASNDSGLSHYNQAAEIAEYYSNERDAWLEYGREVVMDSAVTVASESTVHVTLSDVGLDERLDWAIGIGDDVNVAQVDAWLRWNSTDGNQELRIERKDTQPDDVQVVFKVWRV